MSTTTSQPNSKPKIKKPKMKNNHFNKQNQNNNQNNQTNQNQNTPNNPNSNTNESSDPYGLESKYKDWDTNFQYVNINKQRAAYKSAAKYFNENDQQKKKLNNNKQARFRKGAVGVDKEQHHKQSNPNEGHLSDAHSGEVHYHHHSGGHVKKQFIDKPMGKWKLIDYSATKMTDKSISKVIDQLSNQGGIVHDGGPPARIQYIGKLSLFDNKIGDDGVVELFDFLCTYKKWIHVRMIYLYRNQIGDRGAAAIAKYISEADVLPSEIHLSHNLIAIQGATKIFEAVRSRNYPVERMFNGQMTRVPLWLRLEFNLINIHEAEKVLEDKLKILYCTAADRNKCSPSSCEYSPIPQLHLYVMYLQYKPIEESKFLRSIRSTKQKAQNQPQSPSIPNVTPVSKSSAGIGSTIIFLDTNAVIHMMDLPERNRSSKCFTWKNIIERANKGEFGFSAFNNDADKVSLVLTNTVIQEIDHQKKKQPDIRYHIVSQLQSELGYLSQCVSAGFLEMLGAHQGERLVSENGREYIDMAELDDPGLANDIALLNVALFYNAEIGSIGSVILITGDTGCLKMAKEHNLPAATLWELDMYLTEFMNEPWTAGVIKKCIPTANRKSDGEIISTPLATSGFSIFDEVEFAKDLVTRLILTHDKESEIYREADNAINRWTTLLEQRPKPFVSPTRNKSSPNNSASSETVESPACATVDLKSLLAILSSPPDSNAWDKPQLNKSKKYNRKKSNQERAEVKLNQDPQVPTSISQQDQSAQPIELITTLPTLASLEDESTTISSGNIPQRPPVQPLEPDLSTLTASVETTVFNVSMPSQSGDNIQDNISTVNQDNAQVSPNPVDSNVTETTKD